MADHQQDVHKTSTFSVVFAVLGGILVPMILIALIAKFFIAGSLGTAEATPAPKAEVAKIEENIKPVAAVEVASSSAPQAEKGGEEVVKGVCAMCHGTGLMGSPKIGDKAAWEPRIKQGYETLVKHAVEGIRSMPARGGNPALTDNEVAGAVAYMANQAGADFKAPTAAPAAAAEAPAAETKTADAAAAPAASGKSGEEVVKAVCAMCHATGLMGSPKIGDKAGWEPRIKQGYETLVKHAVEGIRSMPARGGNPGLSDDEVARAVAYMANQSGADFKAP